MSNSLVPEVETSVGHTGTTDHLFYGMRHFGELAGRETLTGLFGIAIGGRRIDRTACAVLDDIAAVMTFGDPRIWPLKLTRLVSSYGHLLPAHAAGQLCLENLLAGPWTMIDTVESMTFVADALGESWDHEKAQSVCAALVERKKRIIGFGVPFRPRDERLTALQVRLEARGRTGLRYWRVSEALAEHMRRERGLEPNIGLGVTAACLDLGFAPSEVPAIGVALIQYVFLATAYEGARQAPETLRQLPIETMQYVGKGPRSTGRPSRRVPGIAASISRSKVLVVDDEPLVASAIRRSLSTAFEVAMVTSSEEALERIALGDRFDAVVCDLMMPHMAGWELHDAISRIEPLQAAKMLFVTGGAFTDAARAFLESVDNPRLEKPFEPREILDAVTELLARSASSPGGR